jgi:hypothetical protein
MPQSTHAPLLGRTPQFSPVCANSACVAAERNADGTVTMTSTIEGNTGSVTYTSDEFETFRDDVKLGKWDFI